MAAGIAHYVDNGLKIATRCSKILLQGSKNNDRGINRHSNRTDNSDKRVYAQGIAEECQRKQTKTKGAAANQ